MSTYPIQTVSPVATASVSSARTSTVGADGGPVKPADGFPAPPEDYEADMAGTQKVDVVGPVCESGDFLAKDRRLPPMKRGELLATFSAGAYGMAMSSNYNSRRRPNPSHPRR